MIGDVDATGVSVRDEAAVLPGAPSAVGAVASTPATSAPAAVTRSHDLV
ncbi:hypothetical protein GCM10023083_70250 [Streptomyces phyllanthi]